MAWHKTIIVLTTLLAGVTPDAAAAEDASIEESIQSGVQLRKDGKDEAALALFLNLEQKNPQSVRVLLQVSAAAQATGRWVLAYNYLRKAAAYRAEPYYVRNRAMIKAAEEAVVQHVGQLRVIGEPAGAELRLSGTLIGTLPLEEPLPLELGSYTLEVSKPGFYQLRRELTVSAGGGLTQEFVELKPTAPRASDPSPRSGRSITEARHANHLQDRDSRWWASPTVTWVLGGVAVTATATSGVALLIREGAARRWNDDEQCLNRGEGARTRQEICGDQRATATTAGTVALTAGVTAGVFATAAIVQLLATRSEPVANRAEAAATCGVGLGSLVCSGTF